MNYQKLHGGGTVGRRGAPVGLTPGLGGVLDILEARKMLENAAESHTSGARFVGRDFFYTKLGWVWNVISHEINLWH